MRLMRSVLTSVEPVILLSGVFICIGVAAHLRLKSHADRDEPLVLFRYLGITTGISGLAILPVSTTLRPIFTPPAQAHSLSLGVFVIATILGAGLWWIAWDCLAAEQSIIKQQLQHRIS